VNVEEKLKCFNFFKANGHPTDLWVLSEFLHESNSVLRQGAADTIIHIFKKLQSREELSDSLKSLKITSSDLELFDKKFSPENYFELVAIASFNGNGFVRESAVALLSKTKNKKAIRYLLLRTADWVSEVRECAIKSIKGYFQSAYLEAFIDQLPLVEWLLKVKRADLSELYAQIIDFVTSEPLSAPYIKKLAVSDRSRMLLYSHKLKKQGLTPDLLSLILGTKDYLARALLFKYVPQLPPDEQEKLLHRLLQDGSRKIKLSALYAIKPNLNHFKEQVVDLLADESSSVRELARALLKKETVDFPTFYKNNIQNGHKFLGSLMGLSELGSQLDLPVFEKHILDTSNKVKLACLTAMNRLDGLLAKKYSLSLLTSSSKRIRTKCSEILSKNYDDETLDRVRSAYRSGNPEQKKSILALFYKIGGWKVVADLIYSLLDPNTEVNETAWSYLLKWKMRAVRTFTTPAANDLERAHNAYKEIDDANIQMSYYNQKLWKELPFFLRH
jgi:HEAT repeat protein